MTVFRKCFVFAGALFASLVGPAYAHVSLQTKQAPIAGPYTAVLSVPHGCNGSPTTKIRVRIPPGVVDVEPRVQPGWTVETVKADYSQPYTRSGASVTTGVKEVIWSGGPLPDGQKETFTFLAYLSDDLKAGATLYFPVVQHCEQGVVRWIDGGPVNGNSAHDHSQSPAPRLTLLPKK